MVFRNDSSLKASAKVAVITRTKDRPVFLQRAIESVLGQRFSDWMHVIVNDGGKPAAVDILVKSYAIEYAGRVRVLHHAESTGMQEASNAGLLASDSCYVVVHDDDDSWEPGFLSAGVAYLDRQGEQSLIQGVVSQSMQILEEITPGGEVRETGRLPYQPFAFVNIGEMRQRNLFPPIAFLYRRRVHDLVGLFRQQFDVLGDHDFNLRFLRRYEIGVLAEFNACYHWRHGSEGNTVTAGRETHRRMLCRFKNVLYREYLSSPVDAVGPVDDISMPPPFNRDMGPFKARADSAARITAMPDLLQEFDFKVLSLDVFDTALRRLCHQPKDVFRLLEARSCSELKLPELPYALARVRAEEGLRKRLGGEVSLPMIYAELRHLCGLDAAQADAMQELELRIEADLLYADPRWVEAYGQLRAAGRTVVFTSDMYLSSVQISAWLQACGFADARVFVSSEYDKTKHSGDLFALVESILGVSGNEILHVGDNFHSDCMKARQAGWQAFHWSSKFSYTPWYAEVSPHYYDAEDCLSSAIMGMVRRRGEQQAWGGHELLHKLGYEAAGPLYFSYLRWVVRAAQQDGISHLILIGRDGYYWEKALRILAPQWAPELRFTYLHASRKVINFASFDGLDEAALEFLLTPNPALRVRDFISRTGLDADVYTDAMRTAGFANPEQVLTPEMGGSFLDSGHAHRLQYLFQLLEADLRVLFERDRAGLRLALQQAGFSAGDSAFVDIGWRASSVKPMPRIVDLADGETVSGFYFGTWKEAALDPDTKRVRIRSYFMEFGKPAEHEALIRESVNWIESLHSAPYPTLVGLKIVDGALCPEFSATSRGGYSPAQQQLIWQGAAGFLQDALRLRLPLPRPHDGFSYIFLLLKRLIVEPSAAEAAVWGKLEHSDGFGLEVYKPLVMPVSEAAKAEELMDAYRGSNWRRGFLASLSDSHRAFVLQRLEATKPKTFEQLVADLDHKIRQNDDLWAENARLKYEQGVDKQRIEELQQMVSLLQNDCHKLEGDLAWKANQTDEFWAEVNRLHAELDARTRQAEQLATERGALETEAGRLHTELDARTRQAEELGRQCDEMTATVAGIHAQLEQRAVESDRLQQAQRAALAETAAITEQMAQLQAELESVSERAATVDDNYRAIHAELDSLRAVEAQLRAAWGDRRQLAKRFFSRI